MADSAPTSPDTDECQPRVSGPSLLARGGLAGAFAGGAAARGPCAIQFERAPLHRRGLRRRAASFLGLFRRICGYPNGDQASESPFARLRGRSMAMGTTSSNNSMSVSSHLRQR